MSQRTPSDEHGSSRSYITGFILALLLTSTAFYSASEHPFSGWAMVYLLMGLAVLQMLVQLIYFLNIDREESPRLKLLSFAFMGLIVAILVTGSLWIMHHLQYHLHSPAEVERSITEDEGFRLEP